LGHITIIDTKGGPYHHKQNLFTFPNVGHTTIIDKRALSYVIVGVIENAVNLGNDEVGDDVDGDEGDGVERGGN